MHAVHISRRLMLFVLIALCQLVIASHSVANAQDSYEMWGSLNRETAIFEPGEKMTFTIKLLKDDQPVEDCVLSWERTGDDGITEKGSAISTKDGAQITASMNQPGFMRLYVTATDPDGRKAMTKVKGKDKPVFFDGGACVAPETLKGIDEPSDFDAFWESEKKELASVPLKVLEKVQIAEDNKAVAYDVKIDCAGGMPVSGYLVMPKNAKDASLPAEVGYHGYGVRSANYRLNQGYDKIYLNINAHGIENGKPQAYYNELKQGKLKGYAFSQEENSDPKTTYFRGMYFRVMRSLEFVKSLPQWNGKDLKAAGGSQGGLQALVAAGLDTDVSECWAWSPWCCDFGRTELGRLVGHWYVKYTPALLYYDPINLLKRANPKCSLYIVANLGDYVCPPSGVWIAYNNFPGPKTIETRQGCEHGYAMKNYPKFIVTNKADK